MFNEALDGYLDAHATPLEALLQENYEETYASLSSAQMIAGPVVGRMLRLLVAMTAPRLVLEIGTFTGYSALAMAGGLPPEGRIVTCELSPERAAFAQGYFDRSPWRDRIDLRVGPALETVTALDGPFDFVFIDADKDGYPATTRRSSPSSRHAALIVVDNTLRGGRVVDARRRAATGSWRRSTTTSRPTSARRTSCSASATAEPDPAGT